MSVRNSLTHDFAQACSRLEGSAIPGDVRRLARVALLDFLGVALAGSTEPLSGIVTDDCAENGAAPQSVLPGRTLRLSAADAALVNGVAGHALDDDDVSLALSGHQGAAVWPAVLALGARIGVIEAERG